MRVERCASPDEFLATTEDYRGRDPIRTNVLGSVATTVSKQGASRGDCFWWVAREGAEVVGAAMRTAPWVLSLGPMPDGAAAALATEVARSDPSFPGVAGFVAPVEAFLAACAAHGTARSIATSQRQLLYEIEAVTRPHQVDGEFVVATPEELDAVEAWFAAFSAEVDGHPSITRSEEDRAMVTHTTIEGRIRWWLVGGTPVSMAGHAVPVATPSAVVTRVGPVFTPPERRRHGYAGAVTAALSQELLDRGSRVMLYTDAANPTSNAVYMALGYELVDGFVRHSFTGRSHH
jgi:predicted GNAT family acetyltransferase